MKKVNISEEGNKIVYVSLMCIMATNDQAHSLTLDVIEQIKKSPLYRQNVKRLTNLAFNEYNKYNSITKKSWTDVDYYSTLYDLIADEMREDYFKFEMSIKNALDKGNIPNSDIKAKLEVCRTMVNGACLTCDEFEKRIRKHLPANLKIFRLTSLAHHLNQLSDALSSNMKTDIDLNKDNDCTLALNIITHKLQSGEIYIKALDKISQIPEFMPPQEAIPA